MEEPQVLVVDRDTSNRAVIQGALAGNGRHSLGASTWAEAVELLNKRSVRVLFLNVDAPGVNMPQSLLEACRLNSFLSVVISGMQPSEREVLSLLRKGMFDILQGAMNPDVIRFTGEKALLHSKMLEELSRTREELLGRTGFSKLVGHSRAIEQVRQRIERLAGGAGPVMFTGGAGTGKELAARVMHSLSPGAGEPFITLTCAALDPGQIELELFGDVSTGQRLLSLAGSGYLMIKPVNLLPLQLQERLLELLSAGSGMKPACRIICSATDDPAKLVEDGLLLEELAELFRLNTVHIPALSDRQTDIPILAQYFIDTICRINDLTPMHISPETLSRMKSYAWPGNVRELRNAMEQAAIMAVDTIIRPSDLPDAIEQAEPAWHLPQETAIEAREFREAKKATVDAFERRYLSRLMERHKGNVTVAAQHAGMLRSALQRLLRKHAMRSADFRRRRRLLAERSASK